jgi:phosphatidylglycerol lysyltransferase
MANTPRIEYELLDRAESPTNWPVQLVAAIVFLNGAFAILGVLYAGFPERLESLLPLHYEYFGRLFGLFSGFLLIYFSGRLLARKQTAWRIAFAGSLLIVLDHALFARDLAALALPSLSLALLAVYADEFKVKSETASVRQGLMLLGVSILIAVLYGTFGFARMGPRDFVPHHKITLEEGAQRTIQEFALIGNSDITPVTREAKWFLASLDIFGAASIAFAFLSLFRPLEYQYRTLPHERARARELLRLYGTSSEDMFKVWPEDKSYFFGDDSFVAYRVERGVALVLGEPIGPQQGWQELLRRFRQFCHIHGWIVALVYVPAAHVDALEDAGFKALKIGEDAIVETGSFVTEALRNKHFRAVRNKFSRLGYTFDVSQAPQANDLITQAARVSRSWLSGGGRVERGFGMGYFEHDYMQRSTLYLLYDEKRKLVAFANAIPTYNSTQETIDLMRHRRGTETGTMDYLLSCIIEHLSERGVREFSLGLAPLSGISGTERTTEERVVGYLSRLGLGGFSFRGLRKFKEKFQPKWQEVFLLHERGAVGLAQTAVAIGEVMRRR